jgi:hypothetical protein
MSQPICGQPTASGEPCRKLAMLGADRCAVHLGLARRGHTLTQQIADNLVTMLSAGNYLHVALAAVSVPGQTFRDWMTKGATSSKPVDEPFRELRARVEQARAQGEVRLVTAIAVAAQQDWRAALALLEREFPDRWGPVSVRVREIEAPEQPLVAKPDDDDPFREVDELAERRRTRTG